MLVAEDYNQLDILLSSYDQLGQNGQSAYTVDSEHAQFQYSSLIHTSLVDSSFITVDHSLNVKTGLKAPL